MKTTGPNFENTAYATHWALMIDEDIKLLAATEGIEMLKTCAGRPYSVFTEEEAKPPLKRADLAVLRADGLVLTTAE